MLKSIIHELNYLKFENVLHIFVFIVSLPLALIYKIYCMLNKKQQNIWLICEDKMEARDNGYAFFNYLCKHHKEITAYYAISPQSSDYLKVKSTGKFVKYGSIKHWILYFTCRFNISSQKAGKPDAAICYVLEQLKIVKNKGIFLQHGITINKTEWLFYNNTHLKLFICGAKPEFEYVKQHFGYPEENVKYLGLARFDDYHKISVNKKQILLIPSWREWIASKNQYSKKYEDVSRFTNTEYYRKYQELINNKELIDFLEKKGLVLYFYPHRNMQKYISDFTTTSDRIKIVDNKTSDIRELLMNSAVMITDYSSVALDFAYMKKPLIYYQFDEKRFREAQYDVGYYDYRKAGLGEVVNTCDDVVKKIKKIYDNDLKMTDEFKKKHKKFFEKYDSKNSERIYQELIKIERNEK